MQCTTLKKRLSKDIANPFALFYIMPKIHKEVPKDSHTT